MKVETIIEITGGVPHTTPKNGVKLYNLIFERKFSSCLELGFAHGVGSLYIAAALDELGQQGKLVSVDNLSAKKRNPNIFQLLDISGLSKIVTPVFHSLGYNWYLMKYLESDSGSIDFCFIDGAHTWEVDALAFLVVDLILRPGGIVLFDDLDWSHSISPTLGATQRVKRMEPEYRDTAQVRKVFELLAAKNARYRTWEEDGWGYAEKLS